jgi:hypothetical protein
MLPVCIATYDDQAGREVVHSSFKVPGVRAGLVCHPLGLQTHIPFLSSLRAQPEPTRSAMMPCGVWAQGRATVGRVRFDLEALAKQICWRDREGTQSYHTPTLAALSISIGH